MLVWAMVVIGIAYRNSAEISNLIVWSLEFGVKIVGVIGIAYRNSAEISNLIVWSLEFGVKIVG